MVTIKEAVHNAVTFARSVLDPARVEDLRLEEIESGAIEGEPAWLVTLSVSDKDLGLRSLTRGSRSYKRFVVHRETGEVLAMRIRELASA